MKKISITSVLTLTVFLLCSCVPSEPIPTPDPVPTATPAPILRKFAENKDKLLEKLCSLYGVDVSLFEKVKEGIKDYKASVGELTETVTIEQIEAVKKVIKYDPELFFVKDIVLAEDGMTINLYYSQEQVHAEKANNELANKIDLVISETIKPEYTKFENALAVYSYLSKNVEALESETLSIYDLFVGGKGNSLTFAKAFQLLLNEAQIESFVTISQEGEAFVTASINNTFYHFSPYLDSKKTHGQNIEFFGATDDEMLTYYTSWQIQDGLVNILSIDTTFAYMRNITGYGVDFAQKVIYYVDKPNDNKIIKCTYFQDLKESVYNKRAQDMVYKNNVIYFADLDNRNKLYKLDLTTGKQEELGSNFITKMYSRGKKLIYFDEISNTEGSIVIG